MNIYFIGIGGAGLGPLAFLSESCGYSVAGSDGQKSLMTDKLIEKKVDITFEQDGVFLEKLILQGKADWVVYSSAVKDDNPERLVASKYGIKQTKRDGLVNHILSEKKLALVGVAGTHGKTTTTAMCVWCLKKLHIPVSYLIGSNITFGPSAHYEKDSEVFILEADEFDRHFLNYKPYSVVLPSLDYDHPDTYATENSYIQAFEEFMKDSTYNSIARTVDHNFDLDTVSLNPEITLTGEHNRMNGSIVVDNIMKLTEKFAWKFDYDELIQAINTFPGTQRRFEKLAKRMYTDYAHAPAEIAATLQMASELKKGIVLVYQPHQNVRQHLIMQQGGYGSAFDLSKKVYWLPTYLSREDGQSVLEPNDLIPKDKGSMITEAQMNTELTFQLKKHYDEGSILLFFGAGDIDAYARNCVDIVT
jgi:UDP-N-acetylmuramate--alanine ligase